ncbi:MAG: helix-turn-helix domain-containing protein [Saprospiraceae bacterium]|nr:helix-turn-helix domain-containing protein [Saprospiraceae bacterium]
MTLHDVLVFFFSGLGAFNGLLLSVYFLFFSRPKHVSNLLLGGLLLSLSIRIGKSVFFHFLPDLSFHYLQLGLYACFFIGPFMYLYIQSILYPEGKIVQSAKWHLMAVGLFIGTIGAIYPFERHIALWRPHIINLIYFQWLGYLVLSFFTLRPVFKVFLDKKDKLNSLEIWLISIFLGNTAIWAAYYFAGYGSYILGAFLFSFFLYLFALILFFNKKKKSILFKENPKYNILIEESEAEGITLRLHALMQEELLYKDPQLGLELAAEKLSIPRHKLSQILNAHLGKSFSTYVNEYRIDAAKEMMKAETGFSLEGIGYECGFKSKSTFYSNFKKMTSQTPSSYQKALKKGLTL